MLVDPYEHLGVLKRSVTTVRTQQRYLASGRAPARTADRPEDPTCCVSIALLGYLQEEDTYLHDTS